MDSKKNKSIEETYQKKSQLEHVLHRPGMYIGDIDKVITERWVYIPSDGMVKKSLTFSPGLYKIFDEIFTNAIDHSQRDQTLKKIEVSINKESGEIIIFNDGQGIPVEIHKELGKYVPEIIFGEFHTSSNYDDTEKRTVGGLNGYGSKLTNAFSTKFNITVADGVNEYSQTWENNMETRRLPVIKKSKKSFVKISFIPDYSRFQMPDGLEEDIFLLFRTRVYDGAAITDKKVLIYFDDEKISVKNFESYVNLFIGGQTPRVYEKINDRWEIAIALNGNDKFTQISFVNGISTTDGGTHVDYITNQIIYKLKEQLEKKYKDIVIRPSYIKDNLLIFINCLIENPVFSSQTKESHVTKVSKFGSSAVLTDDFIKKVDKLGITANVIDIAKAKDRKALSKTDGKKQFRLTGIPKLDDANKAGGVEGWKCKLILTEGDSAKASAVAGLSVVGRDYYGIFPLRGKLLNVRDATPAQLLKNEEINNLKKILGLQQNKEYSTVKDLRYGGIMIFTDADCLTGDTPLLLKNTKNLIEIKTVDDLTQEWCCINDDKFSGITDYKIWSDNEWTSIKRIIKKKTIKKIFRIITHTGSIDVTEDHPLLLENSEQIMAKDAKLDNLLLHSFPLFTDNKLYIPDNLEILSKKELNKIASSAKIQYYDYKTKAEIITILYSIKNKTYYELNMSTDITENEAYVMGFFQTDGSCGIYKWKYNYKQTSRPKAYNINRTSYAWHISNTDINKLIKSKTILEKIYNLEFKIIEDRSNEKNGYSKFYKLIINGGIKTKDIIEKYRELFYDNNKLKKIPTSILNSPRNIREKFLEGVYDGDGDREGFKKHGTSRIDINGKIGAHGLFFLYKSMGYEVSINNRNDKPTVYTLIFTNGHQQSNPNKIKKIIDLGYTDEYIYDLETENHHFQGGIGQMIVHNCDGSHIKGLIINFIHTFWPSLMDIDSFITSIITPIVKISKGVVTKAFYNQHDYLKWVEANDSSKWHIKYYKGLGTSTAKEAKEYFTNLTNQTVNYSFTDQCEGNIIKAFKKGFEDQRKEWIKDSTGKVVTLDQSVLNQSITQFVNNELINFSIADLERSIPNLMDGFKPSQRKVLYGCIKRNLYSEMKVAQLSGYISEHTSYHHGEVSLQGTIVNMAQDFVGSNNINLLDPIGQFGTRLQGGRDSGSPRYIFTRLLPITKILFNEHDSILLDYLEDDGLKIEPKYYIPLIPMLLVNGSEGIGTGYSTNIPCYNPTEIIDNLKKLINNPEAELSPMIPWYSKFKGTISLESEHKYISTGVWNRLNNTTIEITELPIGKWTQTYKEFLESLIEANEIIDYKNNCDDLFISFKVVMQKTVIDTLISKNEMVKKLKLTSSINTSNMHVFDADCKIRKVSCPEEIIYRFYKVRIAHFAKRKKYLIDTLNGEFEILDSKIKFIKHIIAERIILFNKKKDFIVSQISKLGDMIKIEDSWDYLLDLKISTLTEERINNMENKMKSIVAELNILKKNTIQQMWITELNDLKK